MTVVRLKSGDLWLHSPTLNRKRTAAATAARKLVRWEPERVIFAHGRWFNHDGATQLRRSAMAYRLTYGSAQVAEVYVGRQNVPIRHEHSFSLL